MKVNVMRTESAQWINLKFRRDISNFEIDVAKHNGGTISDFD
jgi:hypothetical protein